MPGQISDRSCQAPETPHRPEKAESRVYCEGHAEARISFEPSEVYGATSFDVGIDVICQTRHQTTRHVGKKCLFRDLIDADNLPTILALQRWNEEAHPTRDVYDEGALLAHELGAAGIEIYRAHGYCVDLFFSHETNLRTNSYGEPTLLEWAQHPVEIVRAIRKTVGQDLLMDFRFSQWEGIDYEGKNSSSPGAG
ncbi:hypothetical protein A1O7_04950 [Cladophialophora yegresii CBS 114405]|uniref:NADH:flavin oxidoreductase/NADH oxidase N-terminal domain-containing protein n=1 Tax=Cladophialophora yegresii CBS 114405 TaxID=1182544 RepID=W9VY83_9EURO|nr:uncharacterized protein A1O7_04950 [Cladophialophora yegresii CBS 114405]EXJ60797.1 hypothetical protein A1O7_04950 [Cladophialophora yegresii CBS 114405]